MSIFNRILAPIQTTMTDQVVFDQALGLAQQNRANLMLLHVFSPHTKSTPTLPNPVLYRYPLVTDELMRDYRQRWEEVENQGLAMLKDLAAQAQSAGVEVEFSQNFGSIGNMICTIADHWNADLIVIRQPNRSKLDELVIGSVSHYVLHHAACPVLTVPELK